MYLRIFWAYLPFKLACYSALAFITLPSAAIILITILSCDPIPFFWDRDLPAGRCTDVAALAYANSGLAVAQDALLMALPVAMLWRLNMPQRRKVLVGGMLAVGSVGLVATVVRLRTLAVFDSLADPTWDYVPVVYWTSVELAAGIVASALPAVRKLGEMGFGGGGGGGGGGGSSGSVRLERRRRPTAGVGGGWGGWVGVVEG